MVRRSMVSREIGLEEKQGYVPNPMIQELFFSLPVVAAPTIPDIVVPVPVVIPLVATMSEDQESVLQEPIELAVVHEDEMQQPQIEDVPQAEAR